MPVETSPRPVSGEASLTPEARQRFVEALDEEMVLVGGQALAFWMERFDILAIGASMISRDGAVIGTLERAYTLRDELRAQITTPLRSARTAIVAQIQLDVGGGERANIDVLHQLYTLGGLKKSSEFTRRVVAHSALLELPSGRRIRVMNPFDMLDSRVQNAVGLRDEKGPHVLTQAIWAIQVAGEALLRLAAHPRAGEAGKERLGIRLRQVFALASSSGGRRLQAEHGLDVLDAIDTVKLKAMSPAHATQLDRIAASRTAARE